MADVNKPDKVSAITGSVAPLRLPDPASFFFEAYPACSPAVFN
jgi:hypothetical protein